MKFSEKDFIQTVHLLATYILINREYCKISKVFRFLENRTHT